MRQIYTKPYLLLIQYTTNEQKVGHFSELVSKINLIFMYGFFEHAY